MTAIAAETFYVNDPTNRPIKHRIELRKMPHVTEKDNTGKETIYTHGIWSNGEYTEYLTANQAQSRLFAKGVCAWPEYNPEVDK